MPQVRPAHAGPGLAGTLLFAATLALAFAPAVARAEPGAAAAARWIHRHAAHIATVSPDAPDGDLAAFDAIVGDARVAGFGEATHGGREFFQLKDRIFRRLVTHDGFTAFAIEANYAAGDALDAYVRGGPGDAEALVEGLEWPWNTEEVLALVRWLRTYNRTAARKVGVYGLDIQFAPANLAIAFDYLERVDSGASPRRSAFAKYLAAATDTSAGYRETNSYSDAELGALRERAEGLYHYLDANRTRLVAASDEPTFLRARAAATAAAWYFLMQGRPVDYRFRGFHHENDVRDRAMADIAEAALEREGPQGKVFVWAHNAHVSRSRAMDQRLTMGRYLKDDLGAGYVGIGFAFDRGGFQAYPPRDPARPDVRTKLTEMRVPPAPADHSEAVLRSGPSPAYVVDLRRLDPGTPAYGWFLQRRPLRWTGALYSEALMAKHPPISLTESFDALIFVHETSRARPTATALRKLGVAKTW